MSALFSGSSLLSCHLRHTFLLVCFSRFSRLSWLCRNRRRTRLWRLDGALSFIARCSWTLRLELHKKELPQSHSSQVWRRQSKTSAYGATTSSISRAGNNGVPFSMPGTWPSSAKTRRPRRTETQRGLGLKGKGRRGPGPARPKKEKGKACSGPMGGGEVQARHKREDCDVLSFLN